MSGIVRLIGARSSGNPAKQDANQFNKHSMTISELDDGDRGMSGKVSGSELGRIHLTGVKGLVVHRLLFLIYY
jgi:hypothetical protein